MTGDIKRARDTEYWSWDWSGPGQGVKSHTSISLRMKCEIKYSTLTPFIGIWIGAQAQDHLKLL